MAASSEVTLDTIGGVKRASRQPYSDVSPSQQVAGAGAALVLDDPSPRQGEDKKRSRASGSADGTMDAPRVVSRPSRVRHSTMKAAAMFLGGDDEYSPTESPDGSS
ncbi:unnamed protein product, partial [Symbiodinium sp. KB8]